jgi:surface antigen
LKVIKMLHKKLLVMALALCLSAFATSGCATKEQTGQAVGAAAGVAAGSQVGGGRGQTAAMIGGAILGAAIGGRIGQSMDERDLQQTGHALETTRTGETTAWVNPDTGHRYSVQPTNTYRSETGPCRDYTMEAEIDGRPETITGTACRQPDGTWR